MKISLNAAQSYSNVDLRSIPLDDLVQKIGAQLGGVDEVIEYHSRYDGIVVAKVVKCDKHPDADKLSVCLIDDGGVVKDIERNSDGYVQVVCGAPNARATLSVAWIPPGVAVPSTITSEYIQRKRLDAGQGSKEDGAKRTNGTVSEGQTSADKAMRQERVSATSSAGGQDDATFVLDAREIRGKVSNGMLASPSELAMSDDHNGILEIDANEVGEELTKPGTPFNKLYGLDDVVIDIENKMFTHRPDCFGVLGVARELAGITGHQFNSPDWYKDEPKFAQISEVGLKIDNRLPELVPRFMGVVIKDVQVGPSPRWLQAVLNCVGIKAINNIVDLTNYYMYLTAQPLHAYDADKLRSVTSKDELSLETRLSRKGEKLRLLGSKELELDEGAVLITSHDVPVGIGGVMGGADTEVDETTKTIVLECANFDMYSIRRTAMKYGLFTEAVTRFNKGQSPLQNDRVLAKIMKDINEQTGGIQVSNVIDESFVDTGERSVKVSSQFINDRLGLNLSSAEMKKLLENVEFWVGDNESDLNVIVPFWRMDIHEPEDVVEEVGRLYGYDKLPLELPKRDLTPAPKNKMLELKQSVRTYLAKSGANEVLTYSFVHGNVVAKAEQNIENAYQLSNALSPDLQYYRMSLLPSLLDKVHPNIKAAHDAFALFEINQVHNRDLLDDNKLPIEEHRLALVFASDKAQDGAPYFQARNYADALLDEFGIEYVYEPAKGYEPKMAVGRQAIAPFDKERAALIKTPDGQLLGEIGEFKASITKNFKIPNYSAGFELDVERLLTHARPKRYEPLPKYPKVEQDITLRVASSTSFGELDQLLNDQLVKKVEHARFALTPLSEYQPEDGKTRNVSCRLSIASHQKTLVAGEVNTLLDELAASAKAAYGAERI